MAPWHLLRGGKGEGEVAGTGFIFDCNEREVI